MDEKDVKKILEKEVKAAGSAKKWAKKYGISDSFVYTILKGKHPVTAPSVLKALGIKKIVTFEFIEK